MSEQLTDPRVFVGDPERLKAYLEWKRNPITRAVFAIGDRRIREWMLTNPLPVELSGTGGDPMQRAALSQAVNYGRQEIMMVLSQLDRLVTAPDAFLEPDYGADTILTDDFDLASYMTPQAENT